MENYPQKVTCKNFKETLTNYMKSTCRRSSTEEEKKIYKLMDKHIESCPSCLELRDQIIVEMIQLASDGVI